ncbi:MAG TPA: glycosyltransferase, partial [Candidatus Omnitrophota bacterium]|nr:glycosyltransferase [Candidatus Omnitrophota bacterium]
PFVKVGFLGIVDEGNPAGISSIQVQEWQKEGIVEYLGNTDDVRPYLENCDCVVLPSYREGTPRSLLEAAAMELPVIATDVPGCRDVVEEESTGFLVQARDVDDLSKAMEEMVRMSPTQRIEMGKRGRSKIIKEYNEKLVIDAYCSRASL